VLIQSAGKRLVSRRDAVANATAFRDLREIAIPPADCDLLERRAPGHALRLRDRYTGGVSVALLESGGAAAPERESLALLPSGPDAVRTLPVRGTRSSTPRAQTLSRRTVPRTAFGPAWSGFRVQGTADSPPSAAGQRGAYQRRVTHDSARADVASWSLGDVVAHSVPVPEPRGSLQRPTHGSQQVAREVVHRPGLSGLVLARPDRHRPSNRSSRSDGWCDAVRGQDMLVTRNETCDDEDLSGRASNACASHRRLRQIPDLRGIGKPEDDGELSRERKRWTLRSHVRIMSLDRVIRNLVRHDVMRRR
jgi:hypothetical protein